MNRGHDECLVLAEFKASVEQAEEESAEQAASEAETNTKPTITLSLDDLVERVQGVDRARLDAVVASLVGQGFLQSVPEKVFVLTPVGRREIQGLEDCD